MISFLEGTIEHRGDKYLILNAGGIGYTVIVSPKLLNSVSKIKGKVKLYIHSRLNMREGTFDLYGFDKKEDLDLFHLLTTVSGIGPKGAQNILVAVEPTHLRAAVINEDSDYLRKVSGLGAKTAQRLVLELKNKVDHLDSTVAAADLSQEGQATEALMALGYAPTQIKEVLKEVADAERNRGTKGATLQDRVREALRLLGKK